MACKRQPCPDHTVCPPDPEKIFTGEIGRWTGPLREFCQLCGETFDPAKDPYHRESCREANRP